AEIILCEALIDALTFWVAGYRNVTAGYGVNGFTDEHLAAFQRHGTQRVLIAYDRDSAGDRAAEALVERLIESGIDCYRIRFPHGLDANEYARQSASPHDSLGALIRSAEWLGKGKAITATPAAEGASGEPAVLPRADTAPFAASVFPPRPPCFPRPRWRHPR
ncbi:MAG TPA: toprim domain-containing protein, partial [Accumulibacter sp.]|nr:toprim domain-containing protein [Accumulibacter sp.]